MHQRKPETKRSSDAEAVQKRVCRCIATRSGRGDARAGKAPLPRQCIAIDLGPEALPIDHNTKFPPQNGATALT